MFHRNDAKPKQQTRKHEEAFLDFHFSFLVDLADL